MTAAAYIDPADQRELTRLLRSFSHQEVDRVIQRAGSDAGRKTRTRIVRRVARLTTLKQKDARVRTRVEKRIGGETAVIVKGPATPLHKFRWGFKGKRNPWGYRMVWAQIWRDQAREDIPGAFPLKTKGGSTVLIERKFRDDGTGRRYGRKPTKPVNGPAVPSIIANTPGELEDITVDGSLDYSAGVERQVELIIRKR